MRVDDQYRIAPGKCHVCHTAAPGPIIDTGFDDLFSVRRHHIYLCAACVRTAVDKLVEAGGVDWTVIDTHALAQLRTTAHEGLVAVERYNRAREAMDL